MILFSHPTGSTMSRQSLRAIFEASLLFGYWTTLGVSKHSMLYQLPLPQGIHNEIKKRAYSMPQEYMHTAGGRELMRLMLQKLRFHYWIRHEKGFFSTDAIFQAHDRRVASAIAKVRNKLLKAVYGYEDSCEKTFEAAREKGLHCIYELPIAYWETSTRLLKEEAQRYPQWDSTLLGNRDSEAKNERKIKELMLADTIFYPSLFVKNSIPAELLGSKNCVLTPYGAPFVNVSEVHKKHLVKNNKLKVLFVGTLTQRKGLADIFEAFKILKRTDIELTLLGHPIKPLSFYKSQGVPFTYKPPRHRKEVFKVMKDCDVFLFPSIVEGRANVQLEALACGLPLIVTPNAGGEDLVIEGKTGFLVPIRSPQSIAEKLNWMADHKDLLPGMSEAAKEKANAVSWRVYRQRITKAVSSLIDE